jgi:sugar-specific transcriptional regulator TrmB
VLIEEEAEQLLTSLGLTSLQAKIYRTLLDVGEATAKTIAAATKIDRPDVYRVIAVLVRRGFVEKIIANPIRFKAFPIDEVVEDLLKQKQESMVQAEERASVILEQYHNKRPKTVTSGQGTYFYSLLPGNHEVIDKTAGKVMESSHNTLEFICVDIYPRMIGFKPLEDFFKRGGKDRILAYNKDEALAMKVLQAFEKGAVEIRFMPKLSKPPIVALIGDKKEAMIISREGNSPEETECLFTNSPVIAELASEYFEKLWKLGKTLN